MPLAKHSFTIIIPAYNEAKRIQLTLLEIITFLKKHKTSEAIIVSDGCTDDTYEYVFSAMKVMPRIRLIHYFPNGGKWKAITTGIKNARKQYIVTSDSDFSIDLERLDYLPYYNQDITILDRYIPIENKFPIHRYFASRIYNIIVRLVLHLKIGDTQSPVKICKNSPLIKEIANQITEHGFAGDLEFLLLAKKQGLTIESHPTLYEPKIEDSKIRIFKHGKQMLKAIIRLHKKYERDSL